jgi:hypothetical protein
MRLRFGPELGWNSIEMRLGLGLDWGDIVIGIGLRLGLGLNWDELEIWIRLGWGWDWDGIWS